MKVSKRFRWEGAHRLPWHKGGCQNLHGHSYQMWVELQGGLNSRGMSIDFKDIKNVIAPLVDAWDHAVLIAENDYELIQAINTLKSKYFCLPYDTTSENLCHYVVDYLAEHALDLLLQHQIIALSIKLQETETCFAEYEVSISELVISKEKRHESTVLLKNELLINSLD